MYDTSVKVPFIISFPQHIPQGVTVRHLLSHYDFLPTLLDYLECPLPEAGLPGKSFASLLRGEAFEPNEHLVVFDGTAVRMIRSQLKYDTATPTDHHELYDLPGAAPGETRNGLEPAQPRPSGIKAELDAGS
jgi:arylsulfatase A-like enzyme